jgi:hypothetical protein
MQKAIALTFTNKNAMKAKTLTGIFPIREKCLEFLGLSFR